MVESKEHGKMGGKSPRSGKTRAKDSTPDSKIDSRGPPSTPCKPKLRSNTGDMIRRSSLGSAVRSLTPLFNGFSAAQERASQLGGRFGTISRRSVGVKKKRIDARARRLTGGEAKIEVRGGVRKSARIPMKDDVSQLSIHTAPIQKEPRVLEFDAIIGHEEQEKMTT